MCSDACPIKLILIEEKVKAMTTDNASNMDDAGNEQQILKRGCFTPIFNATELKIDTITSLDVCR